MRRGGRGGGGGVEGKVEGGGRGGVEGKGEEVSGGRAALTQQPRLASAPVAVCEGAESLHSENNRKISTQMTQLNSTVSVAVHCFFSVRFRPERESCRCHGFIAAKQGWLTEGNILVFGGEGLSCSGGSWERKAAWGGGQLFLWRQQLVWAGSPAVVLLLLSGGGGQLSRLQHSSLQLIIQSRLLIKTEKP